MARRLVALLALVAVACDKGPEAVPYIDVPQPEPRHSVSGANAFGAYSNLAVRAAERAKLGLDARDTPGNRKRALVEMGPLLPELAAATELPCTFLFEPSGPFASRAHEEGWLYLGRAIVWKVDQALDESDWDGAAYWAVVGTCFGIDLGGGAVSDATLGYGVMDGVRKTIAPYVSSLPPSSLRVLSDGLQRALARIPDPAVTIENEGALMLTAVRDLQMAHKNGKCEAFALSLYGDSREAVRAFAKLPTMDANVFVQSLIDGAQSTVEQLRERSSAPGAKRGPLQLKLSGDAKLVADQFFSAGIPWLSVRDYVIARTRLLFLTAHVNRRLAEAGTVPADLFAVAEGLRTDPFNGLSMGYVPLGQDFIVYSCGLDGKDDRGDTNADRTQPDLLLEGASL